MPPRHLTGPHPGPLLDALAADLRACTDPLSAPVIVVPEPGVGRWLSMELARRLGIFAGFAVRPLLPWLADRLSADGRGPGAGWRPPALEWRILAALPALLERPELAEARARVGSGRGVDARRWQLAAELACAFEALDREQPAEARAWSAGGGLGWRPLVWRAVAAAGPPPASTRLATLADTPAPPTSLWCPAPLPPLVIEALPALAAAGPLRLYAVDPTAGASPDTPPWAHWTAPHRARRAALAEALGPPDPRPAPPCAPGALGAFQRDLQARQAPPASPAPATPDRATVVVHACAGPLRQVEALRDAVLAALEQHPDLAPHEIGLYCPDPDPLAPFLASVFEAPPPGVPALPLNVADQPLLNEHPVAATALDLLHLAGGRCAASEVLALLERPVIQSRFQIAAEDLGALERWTSEAGVRWGLDGAHRGAHGQPPTDLHTWRFGLDRLLLGCALPDAGTLWADVLPFEATEGRGMGLLGRFADFCETLFGHVRALNGPLDAATWRRRLLAAVRDLCAHTAEDDEAHRTLRALLADLDTPDAQAAGPLEREAMRAALAARLGRRIPGRRHLSRGLTLSALEPGRILPARIIAVLGLGARPRPAAVDALSEGIATLLGAPPAEGVPPALAEVVALAERAVWIFYEGIDGRDGSPLPPPTAVQGLLDALEAHAPGAGQPVRHPLHPYEAPAFDMDAPPAYDPREAAAAATLAEPPGLLPEAPPPFLTAPLPPPSAEALELSDLVRALADPLAVFLARLQLHRPDPVLGPPDREPLILDALAEWAVGDDLFARRLAAQSAEAAAAAVRATGRLPHGAAGAAVLAGQGEAVHRLALAVEAAREGARPLPPLDLDRVVAGVRLLGRIDGRFDRGQLHHQSGKVRAKHLARLWISHLALHLTADFGGHSLLVGRLDDRGAPPAWHLLGPVADPEAQLAEVIRLWHDASQAPLPLLAEPALAYARLGGRGALSERDRRQIRRQWGWAVERLAWAPRLIGDGCPLIDAVRPPVPWAEGPPLPARALALWGPVLAHLRVERRP